MSPAETGGRPAERPPWPCCRAMHSANRWPHSSTVGSDRQTACPIPGQTVTNPLRNHLNKYEGVRCLAIAAFHPCLPPLRNPPNRKAQLLNQWHWSAAHHAPLSWAWFCWRSAAKSGAGVLRTTEGQRLTEGRPPAAAGRCHATTRRQSWTTAMVLVGPQCALWLGSELLIWRWRSPIGPCCCAGLLAGVAQQLALVVDRSPIAPESDPSVAMAVQSAPTAPMTSPAEAVIGQQGVHDHAHGGGAQRSTHPHRGHGTGRKSTWRLAFGPCAAPFTSSPGNMPVPSHLPWHHG